MYRSKGTLVWYGVAEMRSRSRSPRRLNQWPQLAISPFQAINNCLSQLLNLSFQNVFNLAAFILQHGGQWVLKLLYLCVLILVLFYHVLQLTFDGNYPITLLLQLVLNILKNTFSNPSTLHSTLCILEAIIIVNKLSSSSFGGGGDNREWSKSHSSSIFSGSFSRYKLLREWIRSWIGSQWIVKGSEE